MSGNTLKYLEADKVLNVLESVSLEQNCSDLYSDIVKVKSSVLSTFEKIKRV